MPKPTKMISVMTVAISVAEIRGGPPAVARSSNESHYVTPSTRVAGENGIVSPTWSLLQETPPANSIAATV